MESFTCHFVRISSLCLLYFFFLFFSLFVFASISMKQCCGTLAFGWVEFRLSFIFIFVFVPFIFFAFQFLYFHIRYWGGGESSFGWGRERGRKREREKKKKRKSEGWSISLHGAVGNAYRVARDKWPPVNGIETLLYRREKTSRLLWNFYNFICRSTSGLTTVPPLLRRHSVIQWFCVSLPFLWRGVIGVDLCDQMLDLIARYIGRWGDLFVSPVATTGLKISWLFSISIVYFESSKVHFKMGALARLIDREREILDH